MDFSQGRYDSQAGQEPVYAWHVLLSGPVIVDSPSLAQMSVARTQVWCITRSSIVWQRTPGLYLAMHAEVVRRTIERHGPVPADDCERKQARLRCYALEIGAASDAHCLCHADALAQLPGEAAFPFCLHGGCGSRLRSTVHCCAVKQGQ